MPVMNISSESIRDFRPVACSNADKFRRIPKGMRF